MNALFHQFVNIVGSSLPAQHKQGSLPYTRPVIIQSVGFIVNNTNNTAVALYAVRGSNKALIAASGTITNTAPSVSYPWLTLDQDDQLEVDILSGTSGDIVTVDIRGECLSE